MEEYNTLDFQYARGGTRVNYNELSPDYVDAARKDGIDDATIQHNRVSAQQSSKRKKLIHFNCNNLERNVTTRDRLRNKLKYKEDIQDRKKRKMEHLAKEDAEVEALRDRLRFHSITQTRMELATPMDLTDQVQLPS